MAKAGSLGTKGSFAAVMAMIVLVLVCASAAAHASGHALRKPRIEKVSLLYVVNASRGTFALQSDHPGRFTLTLTGLEGHAVWFSDRPVRRSGAFPSSGVAIAWKGFGFTSDPPNAAVDYTDPALGFGRTVILELTHPRYHHRALSFAVRIIDPATVKSGNLAGHARRADRTPPRTLTDPTLFIDDTTAPVFDGCIVQPWTDCSGVNLSGANLAGADLAAANLSQATFFETVLFGTNLTGANLTGANLSQADLTGTNLTAANLTGANLSNTFMSAFSAYYVNLTNAQLPGPFFFNRAGFCDSILPNGSVGDYNCPNSQP